MKYNLDKEEWRDVKGYEGLFQISNLGRVKSLDRIVNRPIKGNYQIKGRILKQQLNNKGYYSLELNVDGKRKKYLVHRLVAETFIPNPNNYPIINHKDENPKNNNADNLEWCDYSYNVNYGTANERRAKTLSIIVHQYNFNGDLINIWNSASQIQNELGYFATAIRECCRGTRKQAYNYIWKNEGDTFNKQLLYM